MLQTVKREYCTYFERCDWTTYIMTYKLRESFRGRRITVFVFCVHERFQIRSRYLGCVSEKRVKMFFSYRFRVQKVFMLYRLRVRKLISNVF